MYYYLMKWVTMPINYLSLNVGLSAGWVFL
jgi:hypothetical protein